MSMYLSVQQVVEETGLSESTVRRAIRSSELEAFRCGGRVLCRVEDVRAWVERERAQPEVREVRARAELAPRRSAPARGGFADLMAIRGDAR